MGVSTSTLRRWERKGILVPDTRTAGGHRRSETSPSRDHSGQKRAVLSARVSSPRQREDLKRQVQLLKGSADTNSIVVDKTFTDIGSGLNDRRSGLHRMLRHCASGHIDMVLITHGDRLARFGTRTIETMLNTHNVFLHRMFAVEDERHELVDDMITLVTSIAGRLYGLRRGITLSQRARLYPDSQGMTRTRPSSVRTVRHISDIPTAHRNTTSRTLPVLHCLSSLEHTRS